MTGSFMFRRACSRLLPALLPLVLLFVAPADRVGSAQVPAIERSADVSAAVVADGPSRRERAAGSGNQWTGADDDDRSARVGAAVACIPVTASLRPACTSDLVRCRHSACAPLPRGPPSA
jgi:hypothetical protein